MLQVTDFSESFQALTLGIEGREGAALTIRPSMSCPMVPLRDTGRRAHVHAREGREEELVAMLDGDHVVTWWRSSMVMLDGGMREGREEGIGRTMRPMRPPSYGAQCDWMASLIGSLKDA